MTQHIENYPVCWQDTRLIVGPLNLVYQEMSRYSSIVKMWDRISSDDEAIWSGQPYASPLIFQANSTRPFGMDCYNVEVNRDANRYPISIRLTER